MRVVRGHGGLAIGWLCSLNAGLVPAVHKSCEAAVAAFKMLRPQGSSCANSPDGRELPRGCVHSPQEGRAAAPEPACGGRWYWK